MSTETLSFSVFGAGSWGTALAMLLANNGHRTVLWDHNPDKIAELKASHINSRYLPGIALPTTLTFESSLDAALDFGQIPLLVIPSSGFRTWLEQAKPILLNKNKLVWATKGLEGSSHRLLHEVVQEVLGDEMQLAVISGPNFAKEVAQHMPTATTVAATELAFANSIAQHLHNDWFRAYSSTDMVGVQLGGALKNALAIACGICDGLHLGANARAGLITRSLAEMMRLAEVMGGQKDTLIGLAGVGDLLLTCTDDQSRNRRLGLLLAAGKPLQAAIDEIGQVVEGAKTAKAVHALAADYQLDMPIIEQVYRVLYEGLEPANAVRELLTRKIRQENQ